jgi:hypothetical protein
MITDVFPNQKRVNVFEHMVKIGTDICDLRNISNKFLCICVCLSSIDLFIFR